MDQELNRPLNKNDFATYDRLKLKWKGLNVEDIILDGLYINSVRLVREYFEKVLKIDLKPSKIREIGLKSVLQLLADKDLRGAETLLNHMNYDFNQKIYQICFYTPYKQLRDYLVNVLIDKKKLNETELDIVNYLQKVETYYACRSYSVAKKAIPQYKAYHLNWRGSSSDGQMPKKDDFFSCKELVESLEKTETIKSSDRYSNVIIEWIRDWSNNIKSEMLADSIILNKELVDSALAEIDTKTVWSVIVEQSNLSMILEWIDFSFAPDKCVVQSDESTNKKEDSGEFSADTASITSETKPGKEGIFREKLTQEMIGYMFKSKYLTPENKELILNYLVKYNVFCTEEKDNLSRFVKRLSSSLQFFETASFKLRDDNFHLKVITNFLNKKYIPVNFLWYYLNYYNIANENKSSQALLAEAHQDEINSSRCLRMMMAFRQNINFSQQSKWFNIDPSSYFSNICIKNFEFFLNQPDNLFMSNLFTSKYKEYHLQALAMSLYFDIPLSTNESARLDHLLDQYPSIRLIIDSKSSSQPVSLYALLQDMTKFDVTKCFTWQKSNTICLFKQDDKSKQPQPNQPFSYDSSLLSFENFEFAKRFAYKDSLDYSFFIKQGRPFFAYNYFIQSQLKKYGKINKILVEEARLRANLIMIKNYKDSKTTSSCIMFSELINADTFKLKLSIHMMNILYEHYSKHGMEKQMADEKCKNVFIEFFRGEIEAKQIVSLFEHVLATATIENFDLKHMFTMEACSIWLPLMCFCKIYNLPYSCKYLHLCAESNQWLMFLIFAQLYQIPRYQVISELEYFTDTGLKQHLEYALHNVITSNPADLSALNNVTNKLNSAIKKTGNKFTSMLTSSNWFNKNKKSRKTGSKSSKLTDKKSNDSTDNEDYEYEDTAKQTEQFRDTLESIDFYELLISCQNSPDQVYRLQLEALRWQTPVLAVFATFYQHDKISCLCTFLYSSMRIYQNVQKHLEARAVLSSQKTDGKTVSTPLFGLNDLKEAIQIAASKSYLRTLLNALRIFIPKTILDIYVEFLYNVFVSKDRATAQQLFSTFKLEHLKVTLNKYQSFIPFEWYEDVISKLTRITILKCHTIEDLQNLTHIFGSSNEYKRLIKLVHILKSNKISVNLEEWLDMDDRSEQFNEICFKVIEELLKMQNFNEAEELADFCELTKDRIHLARIGRKIEVLRLNNDFDEILEFWKNSHIQLMKIGIKDIDFIDFLKFQNSRSNLMLERIVLLNLICQLCPNDQETSKNLFVLLFHFVVDYKKKNEVGSLREIFKKMLLFGRLKDDPVKELLDYVVKEGRVNDFSESNATLSEQDKDALNILLYNLVEIGKLTQAYVIAKYFRYFNQDFRILLNMIYICLDMIKPEELNYTNQTFDATSFKGVKLTNVLRSLSRPSESSESVKDRTAYLGKLVGLCNYGNKFSKRIKLDFQISNEILRVSFIKMLNENEWNLFKMVLYSSHPSKFEIAREFVKTYDLNMTRLCDFVLDELLNTLNIYISMNKNAYGNSPNKPMILDPLNNDQFSQLIKIFDKDINLFGMKLLNKSRSILNDAKNSAVADDYTLPTELLIRSHDCFIQSCSMEGISNVLQTCKLCAQRLEKAGEFNIMMRLLTGIAHFSEMTYIMDYLYNNNQCEMLVDKNMIKGTGKDGKLKLALLDYLKRNHPDDHATYTMVTLNFTMHREIATMLEEAAYQQLRILENKKLENTPESLTDLRSILQYFSDAAQSYMKDDCVKQTESCIKKARLVALQIHFLSSNTTIINLSPTAASKFILNHPKFWEAYIVSEAYNKKSEWPQALFNQFILNSNEKYLVDFKTHLQLNGSMIEEVSNRFKLWLSEASGRSTTECEENMKKLLKHSKDIVQFYRLATSLEFKDLVDEMQTKNYSSIINDLIMNKKI